MAVGSRRKRPVDRIAWRPMLKAQIEIVAEGTDPIGVYFDPAKAPVKIHSGNCHWARQRT